MADVAESLRKRPRNFSGDRAFLLMVRQNNHSREYCEEPIPPCRQLYSVEDNVDTKNLPLKKRAYQTSPRYSRLKSSDDNDRRDGEVKPGSPITSTAYTRKWSLPKRLHVVVQSLAVEVTHSPTHVHRFFPQGSISTDSPAFFS